MHKQFLLLTAMFLVRGTFPSKLVKFSVREWKSIIPFLLATLTSSPDLLSSNTRRLSRRLKMIEDRLAVNIPLPIRSDRLCMRREKFLVRSV